MKNKKAIAFIACITSLLLTAGCSATASTSQDTSKDNSLDSGFTYTPPASSGSVGNSDTSGNITTTGSITVNSSDDYYFTDWKSQSYTEINLASGSASITRSGIYVLSGTLADGSVTVNVDKDADTGTVFLVLNNASIASRAATPINIIEAKKAVIILEQGSTNTVTQGSIQTTDTEFPSAAIFSKADTAITGSGSLNVTTEYNDGITSKDDLIITGGNITIKAAQDGIVGKDLLYVESAVINITSGKDGMRATNDTDADRGNTLIASGTITINAADDGIRAEKLLEIKDGQINITSSYEGLEGSSVTVSGGKISIVSSDDGINANSNTGAITISGGEISIKAGGDGIDSNGSLTISGGNIVIDISVVGQADTPLDYDGTGTFTGGTITDQNGNAIDPSVRTGPGGMGGGKGGMGGAGGKGTRPSRTPEAGTPESGTQSMPSV